MTRLLTCALTSLSLLVASPLRAEEVPPADGKRAETLFEEGRRALTDEDYALACSKFAESQRLDPGAGTLMNLGTCEEGLGHDAAALANFREALSMLPPDDDRVEFARTRVTELEARLVVSEAATETARDEQKPEPTVAERPAAPKPRENEPPLLGWTLVGVGAASVVAGITTSILVAREQDLVDQHCQDKLCDDTGYEAAERGQTLLWVNAAAYGVGVAALGTGIALVLSHDSQEEPQPVRGVRASVGLRSAMIGYGGRF
ncbi:MAG TPA: hypothetical protein VM686_12135 [Polyangiaceae bacterium]|nr:hypothetical protein [Polyangiaceae bacterium]